MEIKTFIEEIDQNITKNKPIEKECVLKLLHAIEKYNLALDNPNGFTIKRMAKENHMIECLSDTEEIERNGKFQEQLNLTIDDVRNCSKRVVERSELNQTIVSISDVWCLITAIYAYNKAVGMPNSNVWMLEILESE